MSTAVSASRLRLYPTLQAFEDLSLDVESFDHEAHVHVAWLLLNEVPVLEALARYTDALRRLTASLGIPGKYHETLTGALILAIAERMHGSGDESWDDFAARNADIIENSKDLLFEHYSEERLFSPLARAQFVLPDKSAA